MYVININIFTCMLYIYLHACKLHVCYKSKNYYCAPLCARHSTKHSAFIFILMLNLSKEAGVILIL